MNTNDKPNGKKVRRIEKRIAKLESKRQAALQPRATKEEKKAHRAAKRVARLQKLRSLRPFNLKCIKWVEKRIIDKVARVAPPVSPVVVDAELSPA